MIYLVIATNRDGHSLECPPIWSKSEADTIASDKNNNELNKKFGLSFTVKKFNLSEIDLNKLMSEE